MKYIIEINDSAVYDATPKLWQAKNFKTLVFDAEGLNKLTKLDDAIRQAEDRGYDKGYDEGYDKGKEAMKEVVINNIRKMFERNGVTPKFQPEVAIFDACEDCFYADREAYEEPCENCKHSHIDFHKSRE